MSTKTYDLTINVHYKLKGVNSIKKVNCFFNDNILKSITKDIGIKKEDIEYLDIYPSLKIVSQTNNNNTPWKQYFHNLHTNHPIY